MTASLWIDAILCLCVLSLAGSIFLVKHSFTAIVLFISLGLLITFCWIRLNAIDVAIAEAAIGAGLTGAMLVAAWRKLSDEHSHNGKSGGPSENHSAAPNTEKRP